MLKESDNVRSFLASKYHIQCQKQKGSLEGPFPELKIMYVSACVMGMSLIKLFCLRSFISLVVGTVKFLWRKHFLSGA